MSITFLTNEDEVVLDSKIDELLKNAGTTTRRGEVVTTRPVAGTTAKVVSKITNMDSEYPNGKRLFLRQLNGENLIDIIGAIGAEVGTVFENDCYRGVINDDGTLSITCLNEPASASVLFSVRPPYGDDDLNHRWIFPAGTYTIPKYLMVNLVSPEKITNGFGNKWNTFVMEEPFFIASIGCVINPGIVFNGTIPLVMVRGSSLPSGDFLYKGASYTATFTNPVGDGEFNWQTGELKDTEGNLIETITPFEDFPVFEGTNTFMTGTGVSAVTYVDTTEDRVEPFEPGKWGLPVLYLDGNISEMNKDTTATLDYKYGTHKGTCTLKWQGSSSLSYCKKNYTIKFDTPFEVKDGWGEQSHYCLKANYIDHSHSRNLVNAKLWGEIVKSRTPATTTMLTNLVNGGAVDGFPILIVMNGKFLGLYTFNIPKDGWMMGMGFGTNECILCAGNACSANAFKAEAKLDGTDLDIEYITNEEDTAWALTSINNLINACINSDGTDLDTTIATMLDWQSAIDYYIFTVLICGHDMTLKNYLLSTFDGTKWYFGAYDMDCTYGLYFDGMTWLPAGRSPNFTSYANSHRVMELIKLYKKDELKARYATLRSNIMSESNIATHFANFAGQIPKVVYFEEAQRWPTLPNTATNDISQIRDYYRMRIAIADKWMEDL